MFTVNMYNLKQTSKMNLIEMSAYKPPAARQYAKIFDSVPIQLAAFILKAPE